MIKGERKRGGRMMQRPFAFALVLFVTTVLGCATATPPTIVPIQDAKGIAGKWEGTVQVGRGASDITIVFKEDGTYKVLGARTVTGGTFEVGDGKARFKNNLGHTGTFTLYEDKGGPVLRSERDDGSASGEFRPVK
jgi:hypothetical protein